jgi:hypothetical protein
MTKIKIALAFFFLLLILLCAFSIFIFESDFASSIIPGWHTTIFDPFLITFFILISLFCIDGLVYWKLNMTNTKRSKKVIIIHFVVSSVFIILVNYPQIYFEININYGLFEILELVEKIKYLILIFIAIQILYFLFILKILRSNKGNN